MDGEVATTDEATRESVIGMILDERKRQDEQWGGPEHDDEHDTAEWVEFVGKQLERAGTPWNRGFEAWVKAAALCVAAAESRLRIDQRRVAYMLGIASGTIDIDDDTAMTQNDESDTAERTER
jgi:predicted aminopeptidase